AMTAWSTKRFVTTARRYREVTIRAGQHDITAADPLPADLAEALDTIHARPHQIEPTQEGSAGSGRGAARLATDTLALIRRSQLAGRSVLVRADSAFYSHALVTAATKAGADVSITVRMDPAVKRAIASIAEDAWTPIRYTDALYD